MTSRRRGLVAGLLALLLAVAACSDNGGTDERAAPSTSASAGRHSGRRVDVGGDTAPPQDASHPLGAKWNWFKYRETPGFLEGIERLGGGSTFLELVWCQVEREPGHQNWAPYDRQVAEAAELHYTVMIKLRTGTCRLAGGTEDGTPLDDPSSLPVDPDAYDAFVAAAVERYAGRGVHLWAVENEIDARNSWAPEPAAYEELATRVAAVIRDADAEATVYDGGLSSTVYGVALAAERLEAGDVPGAVDLYRRFYRRGGTEGRRFRSGGEATLHAAVDSDLGRRVREAYDVTQRLAADGVVDRWQLHWYEPVDVLPEVVDGVRQRLPDGFPIDAWEAGVYWPGDDYTVEAHAAETTRLVAELLAMGVERVVYLPVFYTTGSERHPREAWRGLYDPRGGARPAAVALEHLVDITRGATKLVAVDGGGLGIDRPGGSAVVVWDRSLGAPPPGATATDPRGEALAWTTSLDAGDEPVVIRSTAPLEDLLADLGLDSAAG